MKLNHPDTALTIFSPDGMSPDQRAIEQIQRCMDAGDAAQGVLCADHHVGYSQPIGGAIAYRDYISPSGVGYDIGCGNKAVATSLLYHEVRKDLEGIMDEIVRRISFGMGRPNDEPVDHEVFDDIARHDNPNVKGLLGLARRQLGTVGAGNHYVDLFREHATDRVWVGVHFGSRGFGHKIASGFLALAQGLSFDGRAKDGEMDSPPVLLHVDSALGYQYIEAMNTALDYAYAGRDVVVDKVLEILGAKQFGGEVHNNHNYASLEWVDGQQAWVVRKGCTPLHPGTFGFVGSSMGEDSVIIAARDTHVPEGKDSLFSAPHGAGRVMSRTEAKGKVNRRTGEVKRPGKIDWKSVRETLTARGIVIRGGDADEAPGAYKRLPRVLAAHAPYVEIVHRLTPIGVAMAGPKTYDPFKD